MNKLRISAKPGAVGAFSSPDDAQGGVRIAGREGFPVNIEPVLLYRGAFGRMQESAQITDIILPGHHAPEHNG